MSDEKIEEKAKNLVSSYPDDLENILAAELIFVHPEVRKLTVN